MPELVAVRHVLLSQPLVTHQPQRVFKPEQVFCVVGTAAVHELVIHQLYRGDFRRLFDQVGSGPALELLDIGAVVGLDPVTQFFLQLFFILIHIKPS